MSRSSRRTLSAPYDTNDLFDQAELARARQAAWDYAASLDPRSAESEVARWFLRGCLTHDDLISATSGGGTRMLSPRQVERWLPIVKEKLRVIFADVELSPRFVVDGSPEAEEMADRFTFHDKSVPLSKFRQVQRSAQQ